MKGPHRQALDSQKVVSMNKHGSLFVWDVRDTEEKVWGLFVEHELMFSSSFRCDQIHNNQCYLIGHPLLCYLSRT